MSKTIVFSGRDLIFSAVLIQKKHQFWLGRMLRQEDFSEF